MCRCRDYVRITRPGFGSSENCGTEVTRDNLNQLEGGTFTGDMFACVVYHPITVATICNEYYTSYNICMSV